MSIHVINEMLGHIPALSQLIKSAEDRQKLDGFPTDTKDLTFLSMAKISYMEKVAGMSAPAEDVARVKKACALYGITDTLQQALTLLGKGVMEKSAAELEKSAQVKATITHLEDLHRNNQVEQLVKAARQLRDEYSEYDDIQSNPILKQYTGEADLNSDELKFSLQKRAFLTGKVDYTEISSVLTKVAVETLGIEDRRKVLDTIQSLDKKAGLNYRGFNIYKEATLVKSAETVNLGKGKVVTVGKILDVAPALQDALGKDVVKEIQQSEKDGTTQAVIDSLPMDLKAIIARYV